MSGIDFVPQYYLDIDLNHFSPSQLNLPNDVWLHNYVYKDQEWRRNGKIPNPNMTAGNAAQDGLNRFIFDNYTSEEAQKDAVTQYAKNKILYQDDQLLHFETNLDAMQMCVANGIAALNELKLKKQKDISSELYCEYQLPGIDITTIGRTDVLTSNYLIELKTKWKRKGAVRKDGTRGFNKVAIPKKPDFNYLGQVAFYWKATGKEPHLIYHTGNFEGDYAIFNKDNCEQMTPEYFEHSLEHYRQVQTVRQNLLQISTDPKVLAQYIQPDFSSFYWNDIRGTELEEARNLWKIK